MTKNFDEVWKNEELALGQNSAVRKELDDISGNNPKPHYSWKSLTEALSSTVPGDDVQLLDFGCGCGYMVEVLNTLLPNKFNYTGADFSKNMLQIARKAYPNTKYLELDIRKIDLPDLSYEAVLSSAVLLHVPDWKTGVKELCRISKKHLILHKTPLAKDNHIAYVEKSYGGTEILFQRFNLNEIYELTLAAGFKNIYKKKTNNNSNNFNYTLIFER